MLDWWLLQESGGCLLIYLRQCRGVEFGNIRVLHSFQVSAGGFILIDRALCWLN